VRWTVSDVTAEPNLTAEARGAARAEAARALRRSGAVLGAGGFLFNLLLGWMLLGRLGHAAVFGLLGLGLGLAIAVIESRFAYGRALRRWPGSDS